MGKVAPILMICFGLFVSGLYWHLWHDAMQFLDPYTRASDYYILIRFGWDAIPVVMLLVGIIWLIKEGTKSRVAGGY